MSLVVNRLFGNYSRSWLDTTEMTDLCLLRPIPFPNPFPPKPTFPPVPMSPLPAMADLECWLLDTDFGLLSAACGVWFPFWDDDIWLGAWLWDDRSGRCDGLGPPHDGRKRLIVITQEETFQCSLARSSVTREYVFLQNRTLEWLRWSWLLNQYKWGLTDQSK